MTYYYILFLEDFRIIWLITFFTPFTVLAWLITLFNSSKPVIDVKNELCKSGLLKIGSSAPKPLLYEIYEHSTLTGDVINKNKDVLLHNYLNENENF